MAFGERIFLTAGVRADLHDRFGSRGTWRLAPSFLLPKWGTKLKATCGTGWRTPTLFQLYSDYGNPTLEPERSLAWDAGFEQSFLDKRLALDATLFEQRYKDYLTYDLAKWAYVNQAKTRMRGVEATLEARPYRDGAIRVSIHYTEARDQATDEILQGRPLRRASLVLDSPTFHRVRIGFECLYVGRRKNPVWLSDNLGPFARGLETHRPPHALRARREPLRPPLHRVRGLSDRAALGLRRREGRSLTETPPRITRKTRGGALTKDEGTLKRPNRDSTIHCPPRYEEIFDRSSRGSPLDCQ
jgi:hypothetical protein